MIGGALLFNIQWSRSTFNAPPIRSTYEIHFSRSHSLFMPNGFAENPIRSFIRSLARSFFTNKTSLDGINAMPLRFITRILQLHFMFFKLHFVNFDWQQHIFLLSFYFILSCLILCQLLIFSVGFFLFGLFSFIFFHSCTFTFRCTNFLCKQKQQKKKRYHVYVYKTKESC